jgi:hypothetical protein
MNFVQWLELIGCVKSGLILFTDRSDILSESSKRGSGSGCMVVKDEVGIKI